jgi:hypothetical protein
MRMWLRAARYKRPVAGSRQPVPVLVAAGGIQRRGAVPGREPALVGEAGDVTDVAQQPCRAGRTDAVQVRHGAAGGSHQLLEFGVGGLDALVDPGELGDHLGGEPAAGLAGDVTRADGGQQLPGLRRGQELLRPAREQF